MRAEVARVFDPRVEAVLRRQRGIGLGHAQRQQLVLQVFGHRGDGVVGPAEQERQHAQAATGQRGIGLERQGDVAIGIGAEGEHARAFTTTGRARMQFLQPLVQRPARAQCLGRIEMGSG